MNFIFFISKSDTDEFIGVLCVPFERHISILYNTLLLTSKNTLQSS